MLNSAIGTLEYLPAVPPATILAFDPAAYAMRQPHIYRRRQFMEGGWFTLLGSALASLLTDEARESMKCIDASHNIFRDTVKRLACRYQDPPAVKDGEVGEQDVGSLFSDHQAIEEGALAYNVVAASLRVVDDELTVDVLPPDHVDVRWDTAGRIQAVRTARPMLGSNPVSPRYICEEWDLSGQPVHRVYQGNTWVAQPSYPWVFGDGKPFIPVVFFRATKAIDFWGANRWPELIEATLEEGIAWTIHRYGRLNGSSAMPYTLDAEAAGRTVADGSDGGTNQVNAGPWTVLQLQSKSGKTGSVGVLQATFDPTKDVEAIQAAYNSRMEALGIGDGALQRKGAESGYAIVVRREGLLRLRKSTEATFKRADQEFVRKAMACLRLFASGPAESETYRIEYAPVGMGSAEEQERRDQEKHDLDIGVATPASVVAAREGISLEEATAYLETLGLVTPPEAQRAEPTPLPVPTEPAPADTGGEAPALPAPADVPTDAQPAA